MRNFLIFSFLLFSLLLNSPSIVSASMLPPNFNQLGGDFLYFGSSFIEETLYNEYTGEIYIAGSYSIPPYYGYVHAKPMVQKFNGTEWEMVGDIDDYLPTDSYLQDIAFNPLNGEIWAAYSDAVNDKLNVIRFDGITWQQVGLPNFSEDSIYYPHIEFDPVNGTVYISFEDDYDCDNTGCRTSVMYLNNDTWTYLGAPRSLTPGQAWDSKSYIRFHPITNEMYIIYVDSDAYNLTVKKWVNNSWQLVGQENFLPTGITMWWPWDNLRFEFNPVTNQPCAGLNMEDDNTGDVFVRIYCFNGITWSSNYPDLIGDQTYGIFTFDQNTGYPYSLVSLTNNQDVVYKFDGTNWNNLGTISLNFNNENFAIYHNKYTNQLYITNNKWTTGCEVLVYTPDNVKVLPYETIGDDKVKDILPNQSFSFGRLGFNPLNDDLYFMYYDHDYNAGTHTVGMRSFNGTSWSDLGGTNSSQYAGHMAVNPITGMPYYAFASSGANGANVVTYNGSNWVNVGAANFIPGAAYGQYLLFHPITNELYFFFIAEWYPNPATVRVYKYNGSAWESVTSYSNGTDPIQTVFMPAFMPNGDILLVYYTDRTSDPVHFNNYSFATAVFNGTSWNYLGKNAVQAIRGTEPVVSGVDPYKAYIGYIDNNKHSVIMQFNGTSWSALPGDQSLISTYYTDYHQLTIDPNTDDLYLASKESNFFNLSGYISLYRYDGTWEVMGLPHGINNPVGGGWIFPGSEDFLTFNSVNDELYTYSMIGGDPYVFRVAPELVNYSITNLASNIDVRQKGSGIDLEPGGSITVTGDTDAYLYDSDENIIVAGGKVDLSSNRNWQDILLDSDKTVGKSVITGLNSIDSPGSDPSHSLFVPVPAGKVSPRVFICPDAQTLADVAPDCTNVYVKRATDIDAKNYPLFGQRYWEVTGLTSTGGMISETDSLGITLSSSSIYIGNGITITLKALKTDGSVDTGYTGTVDLYYSSGFPAGMPSSYTFTTADQGQKSYTLIFSNEGNYSLSMIDRLDPVLSITSPLIQISVPATATPTPTTRPTNRYATPVPTTIGPEDMEIGEIGIDQDDDIINVCFETTKPAVFYMRYGFSPAFLPYSTSMSTQYATEHCVEIEIKDEPEQEKYYYEIIAYDENGETTNVLGEFEVIAPVDDTVSGGGTSVSFDSYESTEQNVSLLFVTDNVVSCRLEYGSTSGYGHELSTLDQNGKYFTGRILKNELEPQTDLYYKIRCFNGSNQSTFSDRLGASQIWGQQPANNNIFAGLDFNFSSLSFLPIVILIINILFFLSNYSRMILSGFLWLHKREKKESYGLIIDGRNNKVVSFAVLRVYSTSDHHLIKETVSDIKGRYHLLLDSGKYLLEIAHSDYGIMVLHFELTAGGEYNQIITLNNKGGFRASLNLIWKRLNKLLLVLGFITSLLLLFTNFTLLNIVIASLYLVQFLGILLFKNPNNFGMIINEVDGSPLNGVYVSLLDPENGSQLEIQPTDDKGRFYFLPSENQLLLRVSATGYSIDNNSLGLELKTMGNGEKALVLNDSNIKNLQINMKPIS